MHYSKTMITLKRAESESEFICLVDISRKKKYMKWNKFHHYRRAKENKKILQCDKESWRDAKSSSQTIPEKNFRRENTLEVNGAFQLLVHI